MLFNNGINRAELDRKKSYIKEKQKRVEKVKVETRLILFTFFVIFVAIISVSDGNTVTTVHAGHNLPVQTK